MEDKMLRIGMDIGSTTIKCVVLRENGEIAFERYERHFSMIRYKAVEMLTTIQDQFGKDNEYSLAISGSAGMGLAQQMHVDFVQEVYACRKAVSQSYPDTDVVIELGGEDAKIIFLSGTLDVCMNGSCAGGTGAFIDQMASLLNVEVNQLNELSANAKKIYPIASRCGVFAKSDIQPLLNQGASKEDIAASIFQAVANQTISGLAQGRPIKGNVMYLGGPCTFFDQLQKTFDRTLNLKGSCPEHSLYYVAIGTALLSPNEPVNLQELGTNLKESRMVSSAHVLSPLFESKEEYEEFAARHKKWDKEKNLGNPGKDVWIGIDAGSTTLKAVAINEKDEIIDSCYVSNKGNPVNAVRKFLTRFYEHFPDQHVKGCVTTGYGEQIIAQAFHADAGLVETMAHYKAAAHYDPQVDFIIDIGGQDIKCFQLKDGHIDNLFLNEACSSGCGSFLQTFAASFGLDMEEFTKKALQGKAPVDLGSRCTVFMNSSVKEAQKDGTALEDIAAGLCISVIKNTLYKVIRKKEGEPLGKHIIVQGGTFLNDAVLRAFEQEIQQEVIRPDIAGLMGAYGCALYAKELALENSALIDANALRNFKHEVKAATCQGCTNHCSLTINTFSEGKPFIAGNQCSRPIRKEKTSEDDNMFAFKRKQLAKYASCKGKKETIGLLMGLNQYELLPLWHTFLTSLGFGVEVSGPSSKALYHEGQSTIVSDTVCFPAKLMHGHMQDLKNKGIKKVFYPCLSYNVDEGKGDDHYNCPVVAYYPEVLKSTLSDEEDFQLLSPYLGIHRKNDLKKHLHSFINETFEGVFSYAQVSNAVNKAFEAYENYKKAIHTQGQALLKSATLRHKPVIVLSGRPYHIDEQICHGIDEIICELGAVVISEDGLAALGEKTEVDVLNQWTYHARLYEAADFIVRHPEMNINLVQLVSFGCGLDAVTTDEVRAILESKDKLYTQIKIDEITNTGAVRIRLRSLFAAIEGGSKK
jgi:predicted CoA-substrate-specific enzyme activase